MSLGTMPTGFTVWFTGMAGSGKSTLAQALASRLRRLGQSPEVLDGGDVQRYLGIGKAQNKDERNEEVRKIAWLCRLITRGGGLVIQSAIMSPYREARDDARRQILRFAEVFVECPTETLIARDRSGQYKRALAGELKNLPGISEPYEPPSHPEVILDTSKYSIDEAVEHLVGQLIALRLLDPSIAGMRARPRVSARSSKKPSPPPVPAAKAVHAGTADKPGARTVSPKPAVVVKSGAKPEVAKDAKEKAEPKQDPKAKHDPKPKHDPKAKHDPKPKLDPKPKQVAKAKPVADLNAPKKEPAAKPAPGPAAVKLVKPRPAARTAHAEPRKAAGVRPSR